MSEQIAVSCKHIVKNYMAGTTVTRAVRGVDLDVRLGELMMIVGPSGCGKTTLISIIAGILNQDEGECLVYGCSLKEMSERDRTHYRGATVGFVFQSFNLIPTLTTCENISVPLILNGLPRKEAIERSKEMMNKVGLGDKLYTTPTNLSGGQQQRVAIARALIHNPKLVVCDEPTSALDKDTGHKVLELFREVTLGSGKTLLIVTHDSRIFSFADRIAEMSDGVIEKIT